MQLERKQEIAVWIYKMNIFKIGTINLKLSGQINAQYFNKFLFKEVTNTDVSVIVEENKKIYHGVLHTILSKEDYRLLYNGNDFMIVDKSWKQGKLFWQCGK